MITVLESASQRIGRENQRVTFVSDLHWLSGRSNADTHHGRIERVIDDADICIWGGDLFDFRWSRVGDDDASVATALQWLDRWYRMFPKKHFVYLNGNHDSHLAFHDALVQWSSVRDRFTSDLECVRIGDTLWLHGDVIEGDGTADAFTRYRHKWHDKPVAGKLANRVYDVAVHARVHRAAAIAGHRKRNTCRRLIRWMNRQPTEQTIGIKRVVFGHTHRRMLGYRLQEIDFYNGGAAIRHVPFHPITLDVR
ncbi:hypothetical protein Poly51_46580 [Rubripirellula tenax]|uniref:Calcineurin-like phosphoesterase domain-containing protein n=1 Tax=Rubripirellula tenax TaxID=2528015 RepID=A0A5C6EK10_9BACT|nr:metallophosphoesterase [Rubripirellula tenax]TWU48755.1 hypothetical protein Poly51_46580 [Rubripirellula tenax]